MQQAEQGKLTLLNVRKLDAFPQLGAQLLGAANMMLGVPVAFLERPDQGGEHFRMDGFPVEQLFCPHGRGCRLNCFENIRGLLRGDGDGILHLAVKAFFYPPHALPHGRFAAVAAQGNEIRFQSAHIVGLLGEALPHGISKGADLLVSRLVSQGAVNHGQTVDVAYRHSGGNGKGALIDLGKHLEAFPVLEACQQVCLQGSIGKDKQLTEQLPLLVFQRANITAQRPFRFAIFDIALHGNAVILSGGIDGKVIIVQKVPKDRTLIRRNSSQQVIRPLVMQNQMVVVIEKNDALADAVKDAGFQTVQHSMGGIGKAAPVQQKGSKAVTADGVIQKAVYTFLRPEKEYTVYGNDSEDSQDYKAVLGTVFLRDPAHFPNQQHNNHRNQHIGKRQMQVVKRLHLIAVHRDHSISRDIMNRDFIKRIDEKNDDLKQCV